GHLGSAASAAPRHAGAIEDPGRRRQAHRGEERRIGETTMATTYKIHPDIGVARAGTSDAFYLTPEEGGALPADPVTGKPITSFRDSTGNMLRQAQRFRVFASDDAHTSAAQRQHGAMRV